MKHKHYDMIVKWAEEPERYEIFSRSDPDLDWSKTAFSRWDEEYEYRLIDKQEKKQDKFIEVELDWRKYYPRTETNNGNEAIALGVSYYFNEVRYRCVGFKHDNLRACAIGIWKDRDVYKTSYATHAILERVD